MRRYEPRFHSTTRNGPLPTGFAFLNVEARRLRRDLLPDVLGQDGDPQAQEVGLGLVGDELNGVVVDLDRLRDALGGARVRRHLVVDDVVVGEDHVVGSQRLPVLPGDVVVQVKGPGLAVGRGLPALGDAVRARHEVFGAPLDEVLVVGGEDLPGGLVVADEGVEVVDVLGDADAQHDLVAGARRSGQPPAPCGAPEPPSRRRPQEREGRPRRRPRRAGACPPTRCAATAVS